MFLVLATGLGAQAKPAGPSAAEFQKALEAELRATLKGVQGEVDKIVGESAQDRKHAMAALSALDRLGVADGLLSRLAVEKRGRARLFVGVWRAMVYWRMGAQQAKRAAETGLRVREEASAAGAYGSHYRTVLLILLWRTLPESGFRKVIEDGRGDREYLCLESTLRELEKAKWDRRMISLLRMLRADIRLTREPYLAVNELRELSQDFGGREGDVEDRNECLSRLAWHFIELRDYARADIFLAPLPRKVSRYPRALIAYLQGDFEYAAEEAQALWDAEKQPRHVLLLANAQEGQAQEARSVGETDTAATHYREALASYQIARQQGDELLKAAAHNGRGDCFLGLDDFKSAEAAYREALRLLAGLGKQTTVRAEVAETHKDLGRLAERRGDPAAAMGEYSAALDLVEAIRRDVPLDSLGIAWLERRHMEAVDGILRLCGSGGAQPTPIQGLLAIDRMKARGLLDWLGGPPSPRDLDGFRQALGAVTRARTVAELRSQRRALEGLRDVGRKGPRAAPLSAEQLSSLLAAEPGTLFLSYWIGKDLETSRVYLVVAHGAADVRLLDLGDTFAGRRHSRKALEAVQRPQGDPWPILAAAADFFVPASVRDLVAVCERVVFCPDVELGALPIEAFCTGEKPLGTEKPIYRAPSFAVYQRLRHRLARVGGRALVVDSVPLPRRQQNLHDLDPLLHSAAEGDLVVRAHAGHVRLQAAAASFAGLRARLRDDGGFALLHINCHAVHHPRIPSASLLMLSDGPLDMASLATLDLRGMLVVFSSCQSKGASIAGGEGVKGLLWGPLGAGARAVVASHWDVNQQATKDLMGQFHHHLARGADEAEAMRRARATLAAAKNYAHPSYWAGFGVYAATPASVTPASSSPDLGRAEGPVTKSGLTWLYVLLAVAGIGLLLLGLRRR